MLRAPSRLPPGALDWAARLLEHWKALLSGRRIYLVAAACLAFSAPGWFRLVVDDDVRQLIARDPVLVQEEGKLPAMTGLDAGTHFFLDRGESPQQVIEREWALRERLR